MSGYYSPIVYTVPDHEDGWLLKTVLQRRLQVSRKLLSRLKLTEQGIMLNGERVYISVKVSAGDVLEIRMEQEESDDILPESIPFSMISKSRGLIRSRSNGENSKPSNSKMNFSIFTNFATLNEFFIL